MDRETASASSLSATQKETLLGLARRSLCMYLDRGDLPDLATDVPALLAPCAAFVTLTRRDTGALRGCRGEVPARRPLVEAVAHMTIASATDDPRFPPVTLDEVPELHIEISALTPLAPIDPEDVVVGQHGLAIVQGERSGLLLPQVPEIYGWDREAFLSGVCWKAGLPLDAWRAPAVRLLGFEADVWGEPGPRP